MSLLSRNFNVAKFYYSFKIRIVGGLVNNNNVQCTITCVRCVCIGIKLLRCNSIWVLLHTHDLCIPFTWPKTFMSVDRWPIQSTASDMLN